MCDFLFRKTEDRRNWSNKMWISFDSTNSLFLVMESWTSTCLCLWDYEIIEFLGKKSATVAEVLGEVLGGAKWTNPGSQRGRGRGSFQIHQHQTCGEVSIGELAHFHFLLICCLHVLID
jgi:hypothetical protein